MVVRFKLLTQHNKHLYLVNNNCYYLQQQQGEKQQQQQQMAPHLNIKYKKINHSVNANAMYVNWFCYVLRKH